MLILITTVAEAGGCEQGYHITSDGKCEGEHNIFFQYLYNHTMIVLSSLCGGEIYPALGCHATASPKVLFRLEDSVILPNLIT